MTPCIVCCRYVRTEADLVLCTICVQRLFSAPVESKVELRNLLLAKNRPRAAEMIESFLPQELRHLPSEIPPGSNTSPVPDLRKPADHPQPLSLHPQRTTRIPAPPLPALKRAAASSPRKKHKPKKHAPAKTAAAPRTSSRSAGGSSSKSIPVLSRKSKPAQSAKPLESQLRAEKPKRKRSRTTRPRR